MSFQYTHYNLFDDPDDPDVPLDVQLQVDSDDEDDDAGTARPDSPLPPEDDPFDEEGRAEEEAQETCYDESRQMDPSTPITAKCRAVKNILDCIKQQRVDGKQMTLGSFLEALSWGDADCTADSQVRGHRTAFLSSPEFGRLLKIWYKPPRSKRSHRSRPAGSRSTLQQFSLHAMLETASDELKLLDPYLRSTSDDLVSEDLTQLQLPELQHAMQTVAPTLWTFLDMTAYTEKQRKRNKHKNPTNTITLILAMLLYSRTHYCNRLQRVLAIYFKFKGLTTKGCDTLHALGVTMSSKWVTHSVSTLSSNAMAEVNELLKTWQRVISHDNLQLSFRVFSQRLEKSGEFGSGTAATVYLKKDAPPKDPTLATALKKSRAAGMKNPLTPLDIIDLADMSYPAIEQHMAYHILRVLLDSAEFDFASYKECSSTFLNEPPPVDLLPCGPDSITRQFMLGTLSIPEASYEDNDKVIAAILQQLGVRTDAEKKAFSLEEWVAWIGDQLTVDRERGLQKFLCQEENSWDRYEFIVAVFGWLHLQMAHAKSIFKQYLGTESGLGLKRAFTILERKGLDKAATKGLFHDNLERALYHILEAHIRTCWIKVASVAHLQDLRVMAAETLRGLATRIVHEYASTSGMEPLETRHEVAGDPVKRQAIMFMRDTLEYIVLDCAIKRGDVGLMEGMLPHLLMRFVGGRNSHYATECLELLQGLHREWPPEICTFVRQNCWLVNSSGKRDGHTPIDRAQEARIKDIKVTHRPQGPNVDWEYLQKLHPALPVIQDVSHHIELQFRTWTRYGRHTDPRDAKGVLRLEKFYRECRLYDTEMGRMQVGGDTNETVDFYNKGLAGLDKPMTKWAEGRRWERSTKENWEPLSDVDDVDHGGDTGSENEEPTSD